MSTHISTSSAERTHRRSSVNVRESLMGESRVDGVRDETGAILILALIFLVAVGAVVGSLASWAMNDIQNTTAFTTARTLQYAENSVVGTAMQNIRYTPQLSATQNASPPAPCWGTGSSSQLAIDGSTVDVGCSTVWTPGSKYTRVVTFSACQVTAADSGQSASALATSCAANPDLQAVVTYGDYPAGDSAPNTAECVVYCGTSMTVNSLELVAIRPLYSGLMLIWLESTFNRAQWHGDQAKGSHNKVATSTRCAERPAATSGEIAARRHRRAASDEVHLAPQTVVFNVNA